VDGALRGPVLFFKVMKQKILTEKELIEGSVQASIAPRREHFFGVAPKDRRAEEQTMRIKLNQEWNGAVDGIHLAVYPAGAEVDFPERIAAVLLKDGRAGLPEEAKAIMGAPENKMRQIAAENKAGDPGKMRPHALSGANKDKDALLRAGGRRRPS